MIPTRVDGTAWDRLKYQLIVIFIPKDYIQPQLCTPPVELANRSTKF